jgi:hypothetical protein
MYVEALRALLGKIMTMAEDLWIERECFRDLILDHKLGTESEVASWAAAAKNDPARRKHAQETFAEPRRHFDEMGKEAAFETLLSEPPPNDKLN